jgi:mannose-6-phosphate isomerase
MPHKIDQPSATAAYLASPALVRLQGVVQHYDWGGYDFIPALLGIPNEARQPFAELWMGMHPSGPSVADVSGQAVPLGELVAANPRAILGRDVADRFNGRLPYLFKLLDARQMLSIQAHPNKEQAADGFARENAAGIPLDAPHRSYRDDNHKPEAHVALTDFWMLHGFRPMAELLEVMELAPEIGSVMPEFRDRLLVPCQTAAGRTAAVRDLYATIMTMPQSEVDCVLNPLLDRLASQDTAGKESPNYWALRAAQAFPLPGGHRDRGIFSVYLLNLVHLKPGQGTLQPAGTLHAYLEGVNVELMANSDNVLRGGLTPVNVPELMRTLVFKTGRPEVLNGESASPAETAYRTPSQEFELSRIDVGPGRNFSSSRGHGPECVIITEGQAIARAGQQTMLLRRGDILLAPAGLTYTLESRGEGAVLFRASVPTV